MAKIAEDWKELSLDGKAVWEQRAVEDKERYHREMQAYTGPLKVRYLMLVQQQRLVVLPADLWTLHIVHSSVNTCTTASQKPLICFCWQL
jgi:HMG (high mobility group) box